MVTTRQKAAGEQGERRRRRYWEVGDEAPEETYDEEFDEEEEAIPRGGRRRRGTTAAGAAKKNRGRPPKVEEVKEEEQEEEEEFKDVKSHAKLKKEEAEEAWEQVAAPPQATPVKKEKVEEEGVDEWVQVPASTPAPAAQTPAHRTPAHHRSLQQRLPPDVPIIEQGRIMFFYRPRIGTTSCNSLSDVQRLFFLLDPEPGSNGRQGCPRLAIVGKKRLPAADGTERFFCFIDKVSDSLQELTATLGAFETTTSTQEPCRCLGEGAYAIVDRSGDTSRSNRRTHLVTHLVIPQEPGEVQHAFNIAKEASYAISIKNPANEPSGGRRLGLSQKADYPQEKLEEFGGYAWIGVADPELLEYERCEFLLVGATEDVAGELGAPAGELAAGGMDAAEAAAQCEDLDNEACMEEGLKRELQGGLRTGPMETGKWE